MEYIYYLKNSNKKNKIVDFNYYDFNNYNILISFLEYLIIIIICIINIYITYNIKININNYYNTNNNTYFRKINKYIIICQNEKLINGIQKSFIEPKITAVIITYNSEKSIVTAVRSIQNQNMVDIEILLIDDFSSDNSPEIMEQLQKEDIRIKVIRNKKNKGALFSRSLGALKAKGLYIMALDSDDLFINENIFNLCYKEGINNNLDIIEFSGFQVIKKILRLNNKYPKIAFYLRYKKNNLVLKQPDLFNFLYQKNKTKITRLSDGYIWGKCIKRDIYLKTLNRLGEKTYNQYINFGEDRIVNFVLFKVANSFKFIDSHGIIYIYNPLSILHSYNKESVAHDELINLMNIYNHTKNTSDIKILLFEIKYRWKTIIRPGLNEENKNTINYLVNLLLNCTSLGKNEKRRLINYIKELHP